MNVSVCVLSYCFHLDHHALLVLSLIDVSKMVDAFGPLTTCCAAT